MHAVRGYFRYAHTDGLIVSDPAVYARLPKVHRDESRTQGLDRLELIRFLQVAQTLTVHRGALAFLLGINALRASEAAAVQIEATPNHSRASSAAPGREGRQGRHDADHSSRAARPRGVPRQPYRVSVNPARRVREPHRRLPNGCRGNLDRHSGRMGIMAGRSQAARREHRPVVREPTGRDARHTGRQSPLRGSDGRAPFSHSLPPTAE